MRSVLIANRGEIAVRLIRTLRGLGIRTVAVCSEADTEALHVELADESSCIGPPPATESYLRIDRLVEAARRHRVDAVHPGYGFLSERAEFARAVEEAGLVFLGPTPEQIAALGDKLEARRAMERSGVGPVPGERSPVREADAAARAARRIGYPVLLKAAAGGGGKGIRVVRTEDELPSAFRLAAAEGESAFGSPLLFVERYLEGARHVEVQVLGDGRGGVVVFQERDCSIQRRLQKLVEETPSPAVTPAAREELLHAAWSLARSTSYRGPATVEFLLSPEGSLHFLEVNTRIQVEHPITEMVTGVDLVAEQVRVAEGAGLGGEAFASSVVPSRGAAIELRINAEDPAADFRPSAGRVEEVHLPHGPWLRIDTAVVTGTVVPPWYDPLLAKVIAWGADRRSALGRLDGALDELVITGVATTIPVGRALLSDGDFRAGRYHCQFLAERLEDRSFARAAPAAEDRELLAAALALLHHRTQRSETALRAAPPAPAWRRDEPGWWGLEGS